MNGAGGQHLLTLVGVGAVAFTMFGGLALSVGRALIRNGVDHLSDQGAEEGAWGVVNHDQLNSDREQGNHV